MIEFFFKWNNIFISLQFYKIFMTNSITCNKIKLAIIVYKNAFRYERKNKITPLVRK